MERNKRKREYDITISWGDFEYRIQKQLNQRKKLTLLGSKSSEVFYSNQLKEWRHLTQIFILIKLLDDNGKHIYTFACLNRKQTLVPVQSWMQQRYTLSDWPMLKKTFVSNGFRPLPEVNHHYAICSPTDLYEMLMNSMRYVSTFNLSKFNEIQHRYEKQRHKYRLQSSRLKCMRQVLEKSSKEVQLEVFDAMRRTVKNANNGTLPSFVIKNFIKRSDTSQSQMRSSLERDDRFRANWIQKVPLDTIQLIYDDLVVKYPNLEKQVNMNLYFG